MKKYYEGIKQEARKLVISELIREEAARRLHLDAGWRVMSNITLSAV